MSIVNAGFPHIPQATSCCWKTPKTEIVYNKNTWKFEPSPHQSGWFTYLVYLAPACILRRLQQPIEEQRTNTWVAVNDHLFMVIGKNLGRIALVEARLTPKEALKWPLTLEEYTILRVTALELECLQQLAYCQWRIGKIYLASLCPDSMRLVCSKERKSKRDDEDVNSIKDMHAKTRTKRDTSILILHEGQGSCKSESCFDLEINDEVKAVMQLAYTTTVSLGLAVKVAEQVRKDLTSQHIHKIRISDLIERIVFCAKKMGVVFFKPKNWEQIRPLIGLPFAKLNLIQLKRLSQD